MPSRSKHSKSRHGCTQCKAAHVKCDLAHPACGKCVKSRKSCHFPSLLNAGCSNKLSTSRDQSLPINSPLLLLTKPQGWTGTSGSPTLPEFGNVSWDELELMHHFSAITYMTLGSRSDLRQMWQINIPKMAIHRSFLIHSLFSVAALHMASSSPNNQTSYTDRAIRHHNIALRTYSIELKNITRDNSASLISCAALIVLFAFGLAISRPFEEPMKPIDELLGIFTLLRGLRLVVEQSWPWIQESDIGPLFVGRDVDKTIVLSDEVANAFKQLEDRMQLTISETDRNTYEPAIQILKDCFKVASSDDRNNGMVLSWSISLSPEYIELLDSRQPVALVILSYYAVSLNEIRDSWWVMGWGNKLIQEVYQVVDDEWKSLLVWPMKKIGERT